MPKKGWTIDIKSTLLPFSVVLHYLGAHSFYILVLQVAIVKVVKVTLTEENLHIVNSIWKNNIYNYAP